MADRLPLERQWLLLRTLCSHRYGATVKELMQRTGASEKTIRRDLEILHEVGFILEEIVEEFGRKRWRIKSNPWGPDVSFGFDEVVALYLGRRFLEPLAGTFFWEAAQRAFKKIFASLSPELLTHVDRFATMFHHTMMGTGNYKDKSAIIDRLVEGIEDCHRLVITYQALDAKEASDWEVEPYGLIYHHGALYLVGRSVLYEDLRHWKVNRMEAIKATLVPFERPEDFDLEEHLAGSFGVYQGDDNLTVRVRFSPAAARYVSESTWHKSQQLFPQEDGSLIGQFQLSTTEEIKRWILSFGCRAEVLEPASLREELAHELTSLQAMYAPTLKGAGV